MDALYKSDWILQSSMIHHQSAYSIVTWHRDRLEIDIFLPNWQRQLRDLYAYWTPLPIVPIVHECIVREGMVVTCWWTEARGGGVRGKEEGLNRSRPPWRQTWPQNQHANSPNNYSDCPSRPRLLRSLSWFRAMARCAVYRIQRYPCTMYTGVVYTSVRRDWGLRLTGSQRRIWTGGIQRAAGCPYSGLWETFNFVKYGLRRSWLFAP